MSFTFRDARKYTKHAETPEKQNLWTAAANKALKDGETKADAIGAGNAAVAPPEVKPAAPKPKPEPEPKPRSRSRKK